MLQRLVAAGILSILTILAGCSENSTGPAPTDTNPPGTNATVEVSDPVSAEEAASVRSNAQKNAADTIIVTIDEAIARAIQQAGGGELMGVTLDYDRDELNYECVVRNGGKVYLVVIDPRTGEVKDKEQLSDNEYYYPQVIVVRTIVVKIKDAKDRAKQLSQGDVIECNLENIDDRPTYVVVILNRENRYVTIYVDAETGKERKLKDDGRCEDEKKKNKRGRGHYRHGKGKGYGHHHHCHCDCDDDGTGNGDSTDVPSGIISVDSVRTIVNGSMDSVTINEIKLKVENDSTAHYDVKISRDSNRYEVSLDAFTGSFVSIKQTQGDFMTIEYQPVVPADSGSTDTLVALSVARTAALAQLAGTVTMWQLEYDRTEAKWIYTIEIKLATGEKKQVLVDARTGTFIRIK